MYSRVLLQKCNFNKIIQIYHPPPPIRIVDGTMKKLFFFAQRCPCNVVFTKKRKNGRDSWTLHSLTDDKHSGTGVDMILFYLIEKDHGDCSFICPLRATVRGRWFIFHYYFPLLFRESIQERNQFNPSKKTEPGPLPFPSSLPFSVTFFTSY